MAVAGGCHLHLWLFLSCAEANSSPTYYCKAHTMWVQSCMTRTISQWEHLLKSNVMELLYRRTTPQKPSKTVYFWQFVLGGIYHHKTFREYNENNSWIEEGSNNYNSSSKDIITNYMMLLGAHENVLQKLPSPLKLLLLQLILASSRKKYICFYQFWKVCIINILGLWSALKRVFLDVNIHGCYFHYSQASMRKGKSIGFTGSSPN